MDEDIKNTSGEEEQTAEQPEAPKYDVIKGVFEWTETLVCCFIVVVLLFTFVFRVVGVDGDSMKNTLHNGDRLFSINYFTPEYGDIVVVTQERDPRPLIKRIIATEGQTVDIDFEKGEVFVDGKLLDEPYIAEPTTTKYQLDFPQTVPEGKVFVMGDNRNHSKDSRHSDIGMVDERYIFGRVLFRIFPFHKISGIH